MKKGKVAYKVIGREGEGSKLVLILEDPHTGKKFSVPNAMVTLERAEYKAIR